MQCSVCGKALGYDVKFCPCCGTAIGAESGSDNTLLYQLAQNNNRKYCVTVTKKTIMFIGDFWYLKEKEFIKCSSKRETALPQNFFGMGYLAKRSNKKTMLFVFAGSILQIVKIIIDNLTEWIDKANDYLQWADKQLSLPQWMNNIMNILAVICILFAIVLFFSKKKVIEISFVDKRICVPQKSMTKSEYNMLYQSIMNAKKMR